MKRIAILVSHKSPGTNARAIVKAIKEIKINAQVVVVVALKDTAPAIIYAKEQEISTAILGKNQNIGDLLNEYSIDYIALTAWPKVIPNEVMAQYENRIINLHPGLIPNTMKGAVKNPDGTKALWNKGMLKDEAIKNVLDQKNTYAGSSLHTLTSEFDFGPVLGRCFEKVRAGDTIDSLYTRLKKKENALYIKVLQKLCRSAGKNTVLVVDAGGRASVLAWKYAQSPHVKKVLVVPGNDLIPTLIKKPIQIYTHLKTTSILEIIEICKKEKVDLVDVAQDNAVAVGLLDELRKNNITALGPTKLAGQIEWDKAWAREFMKKYHLPIPSYKICHSEKEGLEFLHKQPDRKWFIKAYGLLEGKGVLPANSTKEALERVKEMAKFGEAGKTYLIEEGLEGEEFSAFALSDGKDFVLAGFAQDHKRINNFDEGPNTGGVGCVSPPLIISKNISKQTYDIFKKTFDGLRKESRPYTGVLYLGGMVVKDNVFIIEFNARWGDPEPQVIVPSIKNDFWKLSEAMLTQKVSKLKINIDDKTRVAVAVVSRGYPTDYSQVKGKQIFGINEVCKMDVEIFSAGVAKKGNKHFAKGGRLLYIVGAGKNIIEARRKVYEAASLLFIEGNNLHYRTDIGWRDMERFYQK